MAAEKLNRNLAEDFPPIFNNFNFDVSGDVVPPNGRPRSIAEALDFLRQVLRSQL